MRFDVRHKRRNIATKYLPGVQLNKVHEDHRRRLLILPGGAETRNEKQLHTNFSKLSVKNAVWFFD